MPAQSKAGRAIRLGTILAISSAACLLTATSAKAEEPGISATGKGITGGALLGGELVMSLEAAFGVQSTWAYVGGAVGGAAAGGVGGYFVEQGSDPKPAYYMLAGGMALVIPTMVAVLQATSYKPPDDYTVDEPGADTGPATEAPTSVKMEGSVSRTAPKRAPQVALTRPRHIPLSLVDLHDGAVRLSVPAVEVRPTYSLAEIQKFGVDQRTELRLPVFQATF